MSNIPKCILLDDIQSVDNATSLAFAVSVCLMDNVGNSMLLQMRIKKETNILEGISAPFLIKYRLIKIIKVIKKKFKHHNVFVKRQYYTTQKGKFTLRAF